MAISIFPSTAAEFVSNNFVIDMNDTNNNTADTGGIKQAGPYGISFSSGDTSFDIYLIDSDGNSVGYSNTTSITATGLFDTVVILGVANDEIITFAFAGSVNNADGFGDQPGAGAFLTSITPTDLPSIDDTATVVGGNFGANTQITFESGATVLPAKSITVVTGIELLITRPDNLDADLGPFTIKAVTTGVPEPTGTNSNILTDAVTAGASPVFVTTSPLDNAQIDTPYSVTLEATDVDGSVIYAVTTGSLPTGLSLDSATGEISGTPTGSAQTFTVTATDEGGNENTREFSLAVLQAQGGTITSSGEFTYHTFTTSGTFSPLSSLTCEFLVVAGGGGGGRGWDPGGGGGGGAGGLLNGTTTFSSDQAVIVGAGGRRGLLNNDGSQQGSQSELEGFVATGGGGGASGGANGAQSGGSGGGGGDGSNLAGASGTLGQGFDGGNGINSGGGGGGGGAGQSGFNGSGSDGGDGGDGQQFTDFAIGSGINVDGGYFAGGGGGGGGELSSSVIAAGGLGGGGNGAVATFSGEEATANTGGGGGAGAYEFNPGGDGASGVVIVRYSS